MVKNEIATDRDRGDSRDSHHDPERPRRARPTMRAGIGLARVFSEAQAHVEETPQTLEKPINDIGSSVPLRQSDQRSDFVTLPERAGGLQASAFTKRIEFATENLLRIEKLADLMGKHLPIYLVERKVLWILDRYVHSALLVGISFWISCNTPRQTT
ncbi:hypothetical protein WK78_02860 [Burkholderia cepacia]|nr:hypothetical protein WK78_02860 [Burkholderia cepacia]